jgi:GTP-binding protein HflX
VLKVLAELDATSQPIVTAFNKMDRLPPLAAQAALVGDLPNSVPVSALTGAGVPALVARIGEVLTEELVDLALLLPYQRGDLLGLFHQRGVIEREEHGPEGTRLWGKAPARLAGRFQAYRWPPVVSEAEV